MADYIESVAAYIRVSTQEQKMHGYSISAQKERLQSYADNHRLRISGFYVDEGVSGQKPIKKRPALQRMAEDARKGMFSRIIFIKLDRFFRSVPEYHAMMAIIKPVVWTATEEEYDMTTPQGQLMINMKLTIAEYEAKQTGERIKLVNEYKATKGIPPVPERLLPLGFAIDKTDGQRHVVKANAEIYQDIVAYALRSGSIRSTMDYANTQHGIGASYRQMSTFIRSPLLYGCYKDIEGFCEGYISRAEWDRLQAMTSIQPRNASRDYIFTGLVRCPECGKPLAGAWHGTKHNGKKYGVACYRCANHRINKTCGFATAVFENRLEESLMDRLEPILEGKIVESIEIKAKAKKTAKNVKSLEDELERLNYMWMKGRIKNAEDYDKRYNALSERIEAEKKEQEQSEVRDYSGIKKAIIGKGWRDIYAMLSVEKKRTFWKTIIQSVEIVWEPGRDGIKTVSDINFFLDICCPILPSLSTT